MDNTNMEQIMEPVEGVFRIPIPVPLPLKYLYSYAITLGSEYLILDLGMDTEEAQQAWKNASQYLGLKPGRVKAVFITHFHPDHVGLAQFASQSWDTPIFMWEKELQTVYQVFDQSPAPLTPFFTYHGMPGDLAEYLDQERWLTRWVVKLPHNPPIQPLDPAQTWGPFQLLDQAGHTDHQLLLYWPERKLLFTGDQVLSRITPNISYWPDADPDPLASYLQSLQQLNALPVSLGLAAHEALIEDVPQRIQELLAHHEDRARRIVELLTTPQTAFEVAQHLFTRPLTRFQWRFAVSETLAHLEYLRRRHQIMFEDAKTHGLYLAVR